MPPPLINWTLFQVVRYYAIQLERPAEFHSKTQVYKSNKDRRIFV